MRGLKNSSQKFLIGYFLICLIIMFVPAWIFFGIPGSDYLKPITCDNGGWCQIDEFDKRITNSICFPTHYSIDFLTVGTISHLINFFISPSAAIIAGMYPVFYKLKESKYNSLQDASIIVSTNLFNYGINEIVKLSSLRQRPCFYYDAVEGTEGAEYASYTEEFVSFYSGDATAAFSSFGTGLALVIARTRPYVKLYGIIGFIIAFTGSFLRIVSFMHWTTDVIAGCLIGFIFGFGIPWYIL
jgi:membrane-associated phospholipid phosphatase